jgi:RNA-directed DNA polymerase
VVNGPEDDVSTGTRLTGGGHEDERTAAAAADLQGDAGRGPEEGPESLQKLMLRSRSNTLVSVRRVTERQRWPQGRPGSTGRRPDPQAKAAVAVGHTARRGLGPVPSSGCTSRRQWQNSAARHSRDRRPGVQAGSATRWSPSGRPGSSRSLRVPARTQLRRTRSGDLLDAQRASARRPWILDADLSAAFDRIDHEHSRLARFVPRQGPDRRWLKAGVVDKGQVHPDRGGHSSGRGDQSVVDERGSARAGGPPPGSATSPPAHTPGMTGQASVLVRYADDLGRLCHSQTAGRTGQGTARGVAGARGLASTRTRRASSTSKRASTSWGSTSAAIDGQAADQAEQGGGAGGSGRRLAAEVRALRGANADGGDRQAQPDRPGLGRLLPGGGVQRDLHGAGSLPVESYRWARRMHPNKPRRWVVDRYFGSSTSPGHDRWVFGNRDSGAYLPRFAWTKIVRHSPADRATPPPHHPPPAREHRLAHQHAIPPAREANRESRSHPR